jgi:molybdate transport system substrate-binding protein
MAFFEAAERAAYDGPKGSAMRAVHVSVLLVAVLATSGQPAGQESVREIRVISPGVVYNAGLLDLAAAFGKETGTKVTVTSSGMGRIVNDIKTVTPTPDVIMLPLELMSTLSLDGGVKPGTFTPLGRAEMGLAVRAGATHPDISTVEKLATALRSAKAVMRSNPAGGSMVARVIEQNVIKRPEFAGVNSPVSTRGEGGQALARGEGDMALQAICEILPYKEIELVGALPRELAAWIDMSTAVSARSTQGDESVAFIRYITRPEATALWKAKGLNRF